MKSYLIFFGVLVLLIAAVTTGCGGEPTVAVPSDELSAVQGADSPELRESRDSGLAFESTKEEATMTPLPGNQPGEVTPPPEAEQVVRLAVEDLVKRLDLPPEEIRLVSVELVDWSDASLGCPQPGMMYAQVITPGYRIVLEADRETYEYHTDTGDNIVLCQPEGRGQESEAPATPSAATGSQPLAVGEPPPEVKAVVGLATEDLAKRIGLAPETIQLVSVEPVEWSDASLGCPQPGMMYAQVITPGFLVVLEAEGEKYEYHTDMDRFVVVCEEGSGATDDARGESVSGQPVTPDPQSPYYSLVTKAVEDLADRLSVDLDNINVLGVEEVVWPDSSLGCPQPGMAYRQVPEDGLLIRLGVGGQVHEYHSSGMRDPFLCEQTLKVKPPSLKLDLIKTTPPPRDKGDQ